ncbi:hypothetical protein BASA84_000362 [Batrachochytrium salamandrivorans]|nr:hypothetical protein BASA84_000362 [Batrachochytrium salamandrivorans]
MTSLATLEIVELLRVDKKDYIEYAKKASAELIGRASQIAATPPFDRYSHIIDRLLPHVQFSSYEPQQTIIVENELNPLLMWVMSGSCRCTKHVPFIKKLTSGTNYGGQLFPYDPALPLEPDNEIVNQLLSISTLSVGDNYPSLPNLPMPTDPRTLIQKFDRNHYLCVLYDQDIAVNSVNLVANTNTEVMFIARNEFVKVAEADLLEYLLESHDGLMSIPLLKLQEAFLQGKQWDSYKKKSKLNMGAWLNLHGINDGSLICVG